MQMMKLSEITARYLIEEDLPEIEAEVVRENLFCDLCRKPGNIKLEEKIYCKKCRNCDKCKEQMEKYIMFEDSILRCLPCYREITGGLPFSKDREDQTILCRENYGDSYEACVWVKCIFIEKNLWTVRVVYEEGYGGIYYNFEIFYSEEKGFLVGQNGRLEDNIREKYGNCSKLDSKLMLDLLLKPHGEFPENILAMCIRERD